MKVMIVFLSILLLVTCGNYQSDKSKNDELHKEHSVYGKSILYVLTTKKINAYKKINQLSYSNIIQDNNISDSVKIKFKKLLQISNEACEFIDSYINHITLKTTGSHLYSNTLDSLYPLRGITNIEEYIIPSEILIGEPSNRRIGKWSADTLGIYLKSYREDVENLFNQKTTLPFEFNGYLHDEYDSYFSHSESWANANFYYTQYYVVITLLNQMKLEVRQNEYLIINSPSTS